MANFPIVTISGSMRYYNQMLALAHDLTKFSRAIVLMPFVLKVDDPTSDEELQILHRAKIDLSETVYVMYDGTELGESTTEEVAYAMEQGKRVIHVFVRAMA